jgi:tetratricopeptide (TPR) repeat protein
LDSIDDRTALVFPDQNGISLLSQTVTFPDSFSIWVRPVALPSDEVDQVYGLQFDDAEHRLRVLFGDRQGIEQLEENTAVVYVRAPLDQWSKQTIDPAELYGRFGWELPPYSIRSRQGLEFAARQITIRLIVSGMHVSHAFGPIEQDPGFGSGRALVEEAIAHPDDYYVNMGDEYCRQRNIDLARGAYQRALDYNPDNALARARLGSCP